MLLKCGVGRRFLRAPWTARRSSQSILKEISPEYSLEGLKLKLQYFGHLMWRTDLLEKTRRPVKIEGRRRRGRQRMRWLDGITDSMDMSLSSTGGWWWTGKPGVLQSMRSQRVGHDWVTELTDFKSSKALSVFFLKITEWFPKWKVRLLFEHLCPMHLVIKVTVSCTELWGRRSFKETSWAKQIYLPSYAGICKALYRQ